MAIDTTFGDRSGNHLDVIAEELDLRTKRKNEEDRLAAVSRIIDNKIKGILVEIANLMRFMKIV